MIMPEGPLRFTADDVNLLIHAYLQDSGFGHSAFVIRMEAKLDESPSFHKHIPRGELIDLLGKALLFVEVESHWKPDSDKNCKTPFSLLEPHVCSLEPNPKTIIPMTRAPPAPPSRQNGVVNVNDILDANAKRKADTPSGDEVRAEKRVRTEEKLESNKSKAATPSSELSKPTTLPSSPSTHADAVKLLKGHLNEVFVCAWNPAKPNILATGSKDAIVNIWDLSLPGDSPLTATIPLTTTTQADLTALHWNPDGDLLAIGSYDAVLRVCTASGQMYLSHEQHKGPIFQARFSQSGKWLLTASLDGTACIWDVKQKSVYMTYNAHSDCCLDIDWIDDETFASCGADKMVYIMKVGEPEPLRKLSGHRHEINQVKCNPDRTLLASCSDDGTARIWPIPLPEMTEHITGVPKPEVNLVLRGHKHTVSGVDWCPKKIHSKDILATISFDNTARFWDISTGQCVHVFSDHKRSVYALAFSPDGRWFATGGGDGQLLVYDSETKQKVFTWVADLAKPGVFEIHWQQTKEHDRVALALECRDVGIVDVIRIPEMNLS